MPTGIPRPLKLSHGELAAARLLENPLEREVIQRVFGHANKTLAGVAIDANQPLTQVRRSFSAAYGNILETAGVPPETRRKRLASAIKQLSPSADGLDRKEIDRLVHLEVQRGIPLHSNYWQSDAELRRIYEAVRKKNSRGTAYEGDEPGFCGHGDWYEYLQEVHGVSAVRDTAMNGKTFHRKRYYPGELAATLLRKLQHHPAHLKYWQADSELKSLYDTACKTDANGLPATRPSDRFLGHGDWYSLLEKQFGIVPLRNVSIGGRSFMRGYGPGELVYLIRREIERGAPKKYRTWHENPALRQLAYAAEDRDAAGNVIPRRGKAKAAKPVGYFGLGTFDKMYEAIGEGRLSHNDWL